MGFGERIPSAKDDVVLKFNKNILDSSLTQKTTAFSGAALTYPKNVIGSGGLFLNGTDNYITVSSLNHNANMTISIWIRPPAFPVADNFFMGTYDGNYHGWWLRMTTTGYIIVGMSSSPTYNTWFPGAGPISLNKWIHVCFTYKSAAPAEFIMYFDGKPVINNSYANAAMTGWSSLCTIGASPWSTKTGTYQSLYLDEFISSNYVWTPQEVRRYYSQARGLLAPRISA